MKETGCAIAQASRTIQGVSNQCSSRLVPSPIRSITANRPGGESGVRTPCQVPRVEVDPLPRRGAEGQRGAGRAVLIGGDDHEERVEGHGQEGLRAQRMAFDHVEPVGQVPRVGAEEADPGAAVHEIERGHVVEPTTEALVDDLVRIAFGRQNLAKGREGLRRQGRDDDLAGHRSMSSRRSSAMRSTWRQASANSSSRLFSTRRRKAARMPDLSWSRTAMMKGKPNFAV